MSDEPMATVDVSALDEATRAALERHVLTLADTKRMLGLRYSDWLLGAPSIETGIAASSMCQDEWGHARLLYAMLKDLGSDPQKAEHERGPEQYQSVDGLDAEFPNWAWVIAANVVIDAGASAALRGLSVGGFEVAQTRVPKMLAEEAFHQDFGSAWVRKVATGVPEARTAVAEAINALLPRTLAWMDPADDSHALLVSAGLCEDGPAIRARFEGWVAEVLSALDIDVRAIEADRADFDSERRRGPGHPDLETIERASGVRNRALFVE